MNRVEASRSPLRIALVAPPMKVVPPVGHGGDRSHLATNTWNAR